MSARPDARIPYQTRKADPAIVNSATSPGESPRIPARPATPAPINTRSASAQKSDDRRHVLLANALTQHKRILRADGDDQEWR